jgi:mannan polymerase II complex ANP1 subunit
VLLPWFRELLFSALPFGLLSSSAVPGDPQLDTVFYYDLSDVQGSARGWERGERILLCAPLRDAEPHLPMFFSHLRNFTYPHHLIDLSFLVSDSKDNTLPLLNRLLKELQEHPDPKMPFGEISVLEKDFGQKVNQDVESRHGFAAQAGRRKLMAQARNWLLSASLKPYHSWVYWRDADVETAPTTILEDLMRHNKDIIVPSKPSFGKSPCGARWPVYFAYPYLSTSRCMAAAARLARRRTAVRSQFVAGVRYRSCAGRHS